MNVAELSTNVYQVAGLKNTDILQFRSYPGKPSASVTGNTETRSFSEILSDHVSKNTQTVSAAQAYSNMSTDAASALRASLSDSELSSLRASLNADDLSSDVVNALTDSNGNIADALLDALLDNKDDESDQSPADSLSSAPSSSDSLNKLLKDTKLAQEYLSSSSGRTLINELANNMIAGVATSV